MKRFVEVVFNVVLTLAVLAMVFLFWFGMESKAETIMEERIATAPAEPRNDIRESEVPNVVVVECVVVEVVEPEPVDCEGAPPVADEETEAVGQTLVFAQAKRGENALVSTRRLYAVPLEAELQEFMIGKAEEIGVDPAVIFAMARKESAYNASAIGDNGASYGLMQVQPRWNKARMERLGCLDLMDPYQNVTVAADLLAELMAKHGDVAVALTVYNNGHYPGYVTEYAKTVMRYAEELTDE